MIEFTTFEQRYMVRKWETFTRPVLLPLQQFNMPYQSLIHYLPTNSVEKGPSSDDIIFEPATGQKFIEHIGELGTLEGNPISLQQPFNQLVTHYKVRNPDFRPLKNFENSVRDRKTLIVENYAMLQHMWYYKSSYMAPYYRWKSERVAMWSRVGEIFKEAPLQNQFIFLTPPDKIPTFSEMTIYEQRINRTVMTKFGTKAGLDFIELYKWLGPNRETSIMNAIPKEAYGRVFITFISNGFFNTINLGKLDGWIKREVDGKTVGAKTELQMQKALLAYIIGIQASQFVGEDGAVIEGNVDAAYHALGIADEFVDSSVPMPTGLPTYDFTTFIGTDPDKKAASATDILSSLNVSSKLIEPTVAIKEPEKYVLTTKSSADDISRAFWDIDRPNVDLNVLLSEYETNRDGIKTVDEYQAALDENKDPVHRYENSVLLKAAEALDKGEISVQEFRKFEKLAGRFHTLQLGSSGVTVADLCRIDPKVIHDVEVKKIKNIKTVLDKNMLKTSLATFDSKYIRDVMLSDIVNSVMGVQNAGIAVTSMKMERTEDISNNFITIQATLAPINGERAPVVFKLPVVEPDGSYTINGSRFFMKKQRVDLPIRKIAPNRVKLFSYYGKSTISRSEKKDNNYMAWIEKNIRAAALSKDNPLTHVHYGAGVSNTDVCPFVYSSIAAAYQGFTYEQYEFNFTYADISKNFGEEYLKNIGSLAPIGWLTEGDKKIVLTIDSNGTVYRTDTDAPIGTMETLLNLDAAKVPMEVAELDVLGKLIPMCVVLGARYGIDRLLKLLGERPHRYPEGTRVKVEEDQYAIKFQDQTLVFEKSNRLASLVLAGFNMYRKELARYNYDDFNITDAYVNILESRNIGARYLRETNNMFDLFIDPITYGILEDMKEPTEFGPLLIRGCQMILTNDHPDETDMSQMRLRGYERMAGAIYSELIRAVRQQRSRGSSGRGPIDINPEAVWREIQKDGSKQQIEDSTPIHYLKEQEATTFGGTGGRGARSMVRSSRVFHPNDLGTISEATPDSSSVAINTSLVANPLFNSLRGTTTRISDEEISSANILSTSANMAPCSDRDDQRLYLNRDRVNIRSDFNVNVL